ncbi:hypothetical protein HPP92_026248 [Vanilla planifolia]|uniref:Uncharacterized protein n=1 Tax=Vanilla planifolia TaxID=51239 RepID=A0A835PHB8_VANPL|nr:hypothetical protein HPP92_026248 [Vanilla planifolia]
MNMHRDLNEGEYVTSPLQLKRKASCSRRRTFARRSCATSNASRDTLDGARLRFYGAQPLDPYLLAVIPCAVQQSVLPNATSKRRLPDKRVELLSPERVRGTLASVSSGGVGKEKRTAAARKAGKQLQLLVVPVVEELCLELPRFDGRAGLAGPAQKKNG